MNIFRAELEDDVTAKSGVMAKSIEELSGRVSIFGKQFQAAQKQIVPLVKTMGDAKKLFKESGGNLSIFKAALKAAGTSAMDMDIILRKVNDDLVEQPNEQKAAEYKEQDVI